MAPVSKRKLIFLPATSRVTWGSSVEIEVLVQAGDNLFPRHLQSSGAAMALGDDKFLLWDWGQSTSQCQGSGFAPLHMGHGPRGGLVQPSAQFSRCSHSKHVQSFLPLVCLWLSQVTLRWPNIVNGANSYSY